MKHDLNVLILHRKSSVRIQAPVIPCGCGTSATIPAQFYNIIINFPKPPDFYVVKWLWSGFQITTNSSISIKTAEVLEGDGLGGRAFALFLRPHPGAFKQLMCPHPREFAHFFKKMLMPGGWPRGGGYGHCWNWLMHYENVGFSQRRLSFAQGILSFA